MQATSRGLLLVVVTALFVVAFAACGSGDSASPPASTVGPPRLSEDEVIEAATLQASHIIQDSTPQEASARYTTYGEALAETGLEPSQPPLRPNDAPVWLVRLKGVFYEPRPPGFPEPTPACFEFVILLDDSTGQYFELTLPPAEGCS